MNNRIVQNEFGLTTEFEQWCIKFDPQDKPKIVLEDVTSICRFPSFLEFDLRIRLDDRFVKDACLR
jgi:hypothetical protein